MARGESQQPPVSMPSYLTGRGGMRGGRGAPVVKPKNFRGTFRRILGYFAGEKPLLAVIAVFIIIDSAIGLAVPYLTGRAIDAMSGGAGHVNFGLLGTIVCVLLAAYGVDAVVVFLQSFLMAGVSQRIVRLLRSALFEKLQRLPIAFFDSSPHGDLMSRLTNDIDNISTTISTSLASLISDVIGILGAFIMMLVINPLLTLAAMITVPLVFLLSRVITRRTHLLFKRQQAALGRLNGHIEETITGIEVVRAFNHEPRAVEEFDAVNGELRRVGLRAQIWSGFLMPLMNVINNLGFAAVACVGGVLAVQNVITVGFIASFLSYSRQFSSPLNDMANIYNTLQTAVAGAERVFEILDTGAEPKDAPDAAPLVSPRGEVEFEHVGFGYRPDVEIIRDLSFTARAGSRIALVGPTGAGKTTIVNLLCRFYDVSSGRILIDGGDIRGYTRSSLQSCFGIVLQDTYLFTGTIRENIRYGRLDATDGEVRSAAETADADGFIRRLPHGYDTLLAESGSNLSQGQRQLIAIARAVLA
ncbi:MAG: ABC transporter ATP-binding protein, partial [Clostridia bacterium]|nr:ABC transporter ATP-binding protein [Clostridia bacterium]